MSFAPMPAERPNADITDDAVLGGKLRLLQPRRGHRVGHDAILLAAAVPARLGEQAVDLGAGVGGAGLALAWRGRGPRGALFAGGAPPGQTAAQKPRRTRVAARGRPNDPDAAPPPA